MTLPRLETRCLIRPGDLPPSRDGFEVIGTFNPAAVQRDDGSVVMLVRVAERPVEQRPGYVAAPRYTRDEDISIDWIDHEQVTLNDPRMAIYKYTGFKRLTFTSHLRVVHFESDGVSLREVGGVIESFDDHATFGLEDPRITAIEGDGAFRITAAAASEHGVCTVLMSTGDFTSFNHGGIIFCRENKDVVLFPEKVDGRYVAIHRPTGKFEVTQPEMWISYSPDLRYWGDHRPLWGSANAPEPATSWDSGRVGGGVPPIRTERGWLKIYHASCKPEPGEPIGVYAAGALLLDGDDPSKVIARSPDAFMRPEEDFEKVGFVKAVVFPTGYAMQDQDILLYYGAADTNVGVVRYNLAGLLDSLVPT